jgi:hypothetical protein
MHRAIVAMAQAGVPAPAAKFTESATALVQARVCVQSHTARRPSEAQATLASDPFRQFSSRRKPCFVAL